MDEIIGDAFASMKATQIGPKLQNRRWEIDEHYRRNLVADIEGLGEDFVLWLKQTYYGLMKRKAAHPRIMALRYIGAVGEIGAGNVLKSDIFDDTLIQDIIRHAEGGSREEEQRLEASAAYALLGIEIGRKDRKLIPIILQVLNSFHNPLLLKNISKLPYDEKTVDVLISILPDDFLYFRQEGMKTIIEYSTSYWSSSALLEIGDERGIEAMVQSVLQHCSKDMGRNFSILIENRAFSKYSDFLIEAGTPVVNHLIRATSSEDREVCRLAAISLGKIGDNSAFDALAEYLNSDIAGAIFNGAIALGELGDPRAIPLLLPILGVKAPGTVLSVVKGALKKLRQYWQPNEFIEVLNHVNEKVVIFAIDALKEINDLSAVGPLTALLESDNRKIQKSTKKALKKLR